ncbi:hypothetical protein BO71DRAFT_417308 [Aspergillus ellipticus CBS 707.79]|uniref:Xylanolytic transcriptional activator regulatory domain-containing protein n=1 Tax=Aspergillus ellipticus CBS 707.79 TaxID=1448320 RepID=A0A319DHP0_9EURO|nr:hypothetical protein BO71DRAFT_417308 [Aspergillus ellipticus CBS 707.79]
MDSSMPDEPIKAKQQRLAMIPKAVRCDRSISCSNCRLAGIACERVEPSTPAKRSRPEQTNHVDDQLRALESRVQAIETQLRTSPVPLVQPTTPARSADTPEDSQRVVSISHQPIVPYEGESSFTSQTSHARDTAETIANSNDASPGSSLHAAPHSLKSLLQPASQSQRFFDATRPNTAHLALPLPADVVLTILRRCQEKKPMFMCSYPINDVALLERVCQKVYFPTRAVSAGDVAAMHGILYFLMREFLSRADDICNQIDLKLHLATCKQSFEADIERYDVHTVASLENIIALTMGIFKAQDEAKPLLGNYLLSAAASHCQTLGYHRESTLTKDHDGNEHSKRRLFWTLYVSDKRISLILGRASYIQDLDIDVDVPAASSDPAIRPWDEAFYWTIKLAKVEGRIYNDLYSATAVKNPPSKRLECMLDLKLALEECRRGRDEIDCSKVNEPRIYGLAMKSWDLMHYSTLTTILRPASMMHDVNRIEIASECYTAARLSLQSHMECFPSYESSGVYTIADYANWVLLYSPLTPVIVIFLHAITARSTEDVKLLEDVISTLRPTRNVSRASERLYNICADLGRVAQGMVVSQRSCRPGISSGQKKSSPLPDETQTGYVSSSGMVPDSLNAELMSYLTYPEAQDMTSLLESWDSGNPYAMDLFGMEP